MKKKQTSVQNYMPINKYTTTVRKVIKNLLKKQATEEQDWSSGISTKHQSRDPRIEDFNSKKNPGLSRKMSKGFKSALKLPLSSKYFTSLQWLSHDTGVHEHNMSISKLYAVKQ